MSESPTAFPDDVFDAYSKLLLEGFAPDMIHIALKHVREWDSVDTREEVKEFIFKTRDLADDAVVVLSRNSIGLLTNGYGQLLAFA